MRRCNIIGTMVANLMKQDDNETYITINKNEFTNSHNPNPNSIQPKKQETHDAANDKIKVNSQTVHMKRAPVNMSQQTLSSNGLYI